MEKVTLDTNILVSGTFWTGDSFKILELIDKRIVQCVLSKEIIAEYHKAISGDEIVEKILEKDLVDSKVVQKVLINSEIVYPATKLNIVDDPDDNKIIEAALEGKADYIISQDKHLLKIKFFEGISIVTPKEFLDLIQAGHKNEPPKP